MKKQIVFSLTILTLMLFSACSSSGGDSIDEPMNNDTFLISLSETDLDFGDVSTAANDSKSFTINNTGTGSISISGITSNSNFSVSPSSATIAPGANTSFAITFSPNSVKEFTQTVSITSNATNGSGTISLSGYGVDPFYVSTIAPIVAQSCATTNCHSSSNKAAGIAMSTFLESKTAFIDDKAWDEIDTGRMPRTGSLTQTQKDNLLKWIESDYTDGVVAAKANYTTDIAPIINQSCATAACHDNSSPKAGLDLSTFALSKTAFQGNAWTRTNAGTMPPSGKLAQSKIDLIKNWIDNGFIQQ